MADRPADGVVDASGEVFGYPGLYVSDGAAIPGSLAVNTSLTILANAERIAAGIVARYGLATSLRRSG
jgi:cholesterol oxidase